MADDKAKLEDTTKDDIDDWHYLRGQADANKLNFVVTADPRAFAACAQACHELIGKLKWYKWWIDARGMDTMENFSDEPGGQELTRRFNVKGGEVKDRMGDLQRILEDMGDTFGSANNKYKDADGKSSDAFKDVGDLSTVQPIEPKAVKPGFTPGNTGETPTAPPIPPGVDGARPIIIDVADAWSYSRFGAFGAALSGKDWVANGAGVQYVWLAGQLGEDLEHLKGALTKVTGEGLWTGEGADKATNAIKRLAQNALTLSKGIENLGNNLIYCSKWIDAMWKDTPYRDGRPSTTTDHNRWLKGYRSTYRTVYKPGIEGAVAAMPAIFATGAEKPPPSKGSNGGSGDSSGKGSGDSQGESSSKAVDHDRMPWNSANVDMKEPNGNGNNQSNGSAGNGNNQSNGSGGNGNGNSNENGTIDKNSPNYKAGYQDGLSDGAAKNAGNNQGGGNSGGGYQGGGSQGSGNPGSSGDQGGGGSQGGGGDQRTGGIDKNSPEYQAGYQEGYQKGLGEATGKTGESGSGSGGDTGNSGTGSQSGQNPSAGDDPARKAKSSVPQKPPSGQTDPQELLKQLAQGKNPFQNLSPEQLQKIGADLLGGLSPDLLKQMSPADLQKLGSDFLQHLSPEDLKKFGADILNGLGPDGLKGVDPDTLRNLSPETWQNLSSALTQAPGGTDLIKMLTDGLKTVTGAISDVVKAGTDIVAGLANSGAGIPGLGDPQQIAGYSGSGIPSDAAAAFDGGHGGGVGGGSGGSGGVHSQITGASQAAKLFPRAAVSNAFEQNQLSTVPGSSGGVGGSPMGGMGGGGMGGGMGGGQGGAGSEYKRPKYLDSVTNFNEAVAPDVEHVRPVIEP